MNARALSGNSCPAAWRGNHCRLDPAGFRRLALFGDGNAGNSTFTLLTRTRVRDAAFCAIPALLAAGTQRLAALALPGRDGTAARPAGPCRGQECTR
jgi:hypothetical protein